MNSFTQISTQEASRIAKRLSNHWKHKFEVVINENSCKILMPTAIVELIAQINTLDIHIQDSTPHLEKVVADHLNRMAQQEFSFVWQHTS